MSEDADDARFRTLVRVLGKLVTEPDLEARLGDDPAAWLRGNDVDADDAAILARHGARRLVVYRKLVRAGLTGALRVQLPRTTARLGARLARDVDRFCETMPRSRFLRDVPRAWVELSAPRWAGDPGLPAHLGDLARHELSGFEICAAPPRAAGEPASTDALDAAGPVALDASVRMYVYDFPVHEIGDDVDAVIARRATVLLGYRDLEHEARWLELSDLAAALTKRLLRDEALGAAVASACSDVGLAVDPSSLGRVATYLGDLAERKILLGSARRRTA